MKAFVVTIWVEDYLPKKFSGKGITSLRFKRMHIIWFAHATPTRDILRCTNNQQNLFKSCRALDHL
ncbi:hypothetical protein EPI10_015246 [Gossypium australe]|uniref:Uncharacterized protein n=1 Tax=Gossypium australe TaxID=47621 RepID=A0A5B6VJT1_9ROSI|nr:hypothetical protein EPI10_015246 [Gossypium australe]